MAAQVAKPVVVVVAIVVEVVARELLQKKGNVEAKAITNIAR